MVTFPGAYHAGFNYGFNFAEAVNFAPVWLREQLLKKTSKVFCFQADWLPFGAECEANYIRHGKAPVFAHSKLLFKVSQAAVQTYLPRHADSDNKPIVSGVSLATLCWLFPEVSRCVEEEVRSGF